MPKLKFELEYKTVEENEYALPVIIAAAGSSSRMQGIDKQFLSVAGIPLLVRTLLAFEKSSMISEITVVIRKEKISDIKKLAESYSVSKLAFVIEGGASREESVKNGVLLYKGRCEKILIHDGARPFVTNTVIENVASALRENDSVTCAIKVTDTVKRVDEASFSEETLDRRQLVAIQTPQGVNADRFLSALEGKNPEDFTDDTSVMESVGIKTKIVEGDYKNIKITTPEDIIIAEAYLEREW